MGVGVFFLFLIRSTSGKVHRCCVRSFYFFLGGNEFGFVGLGFVEERPVICVFCGWVMLGMEQWCECERDFGGECCCG